MDEIALSMLCQDGVVTPEAVAFAQERTRATGVCLVQALAEAPGVEDERLAEWIAASTGTLLMSMEEGELDSASVQLLPADVARAHCSIPIALETHEGQSRLRVAMANPASREALEAIELAVGCHVAPVTASAGGIQRAIAKYLRPASSPPTALLSEPTRRVLASGHLGDAPQIGTTPSHRLSHEATLEQRIEALVLALVGRGVITRADYEDALRRLLKRSLDS